MRRKFLENRGLVGMAASEAILMHTRIMIPTFFCNRAVRNEGLKYGWRVHKKKPSAPIRV